MPSGPLGDAELLRLFVAHTPAAVALVDRELRYLVASRRWLTAHGLAEPVAGRRHDELFGAQPEPWHAAHQRCLAGAVDEAEVETQLADGGIARWQIRPFGDERGEIAGLVLSAAAADPAYAHLEEALREENRINKTLKRISRSLGSELDLDRLVQLLTDEATALCRAQFGAFFYNVTDPLGERYMLYTISGVPRERFSRFPMPRNTAVFGPTFRGEAVVRSDDITKDPRYGHNAPYHGMPAGHLPVRSYLAVPVLSRSGEVIGGLFFGHAEPGVFDDRDERLMVAVAAQAGVAMDNARLYSEARAARAEAEAMQNRFRFLADASEALAESLDYEATLRRVAACAVPRVADWCTVSVRGDEGLLRRVAAVHKDPAREGLMAQYEAAFPPDSHRAGGLDAVASGESVLQRQVADEDLAAAAQNEAHLALLRALGCTSCMMVPIVLRGEPIGVISFVIADGARTFGDADLAVAEELAHRAGLAIENARLYRETQAREETMAFLAEASAILGSSLDYTATLQSVANIVVPSFADWCAVEVFEEGRIRQLAVAHVDPAKVALAHELQQRWPTDLDAATGTANVLRTGKSELYPEIPDELLVQATRDPEHLRVARELGLRSALMVPLVARGRTLGAITLVWAESNRRYRPADVPLMEELGVRAGTAIDNARLYDEAQRAIRARDEFLSIASHELKTPLTSLRLHVSGMQRHVRRGRVELLAPERIGPKIDAIDGQLERLGTLINALLDVSRTSAGRLQLDLSEVDLGQVVRQVVTRLQADLRNARCEVTLELEEPLHGTWDRLRIEQIVTNFLSNALKYGAGAPIEIRTARRGDRVLLSVRDHGIGIADADQQRIFDRFARAVSAEHFGGLGLGLWIVRVFVEAMGGTVRVESAPGAGATFTAELPLRCPTDDAVGQPASG